MNMPLSQDTVFLDIPATHYYLEILSSTAAQMLAQIDGLDRFSNTTHNIKIVLNELSNNIANHAYRDITDGRITAEYTILSNPIRFTAVLEDQGHPLPHENLDLFLATSSDDHKNTGLTMIHMLVDDITYHRQDNRNQWRFQKYL